MNNLLRIGSIISQSEVNGPGKRLVIWTQGCGKACKGCFNPNTWSPTGGKLWEPSDFANHIYELWLGEKFEGITFTGGDPLEQPEALLDVLQFLHAIKPDLNWLPAGIICFTGYTMEEIESMQGGEGIAARACIPMFDLLIDGRYVEGLKIIDRLAGSSNQRFHFSQIYGRGKCRIGEKEVEVDQGVEIHPISQDGDIFELTGFPSIDREWLKRKGISILK